MSIRLISILRAALASATMQSARDNKRGHAAAPQNWSRGRSWRPASSREPACWRRRAWALPEQAPLSEQALASLRVQEWPQVLPATEPQTARLRAQPAGCMHAIWQHRLQERLPLHQNVLRSKAYRKSGSAPHGGARWQAKLRQGSCMPEIALPVNTCA